MRHMAHGYGRQHKTACQIDSHNLGHHSDTGMEILVTCTHYSQTNLIRPSASVG
jgi:hypothetical protein